MYRHSLWTSVRLQRQCKSSSSLAAVFLPCTNAAGRSRTLVARCAAEVSQATPISAAVSSQQQQRRHSHSSTPKPASTLSNFSTATNGTSLSTSSQRSFSSLSPLSASTPLSYPSPVNTFFQEGGSVPARLSRLEKAAKATMQEAQQLDKHEPKRAGTLLPNDSKFAASSSTSSPRRAAFEQASQQLTREYEALLLDSMASRVPAPDVSKILRSWFESLPQLTMERKVELINEVIRSFYIKHALPIESRVGEVEKMPAPIPLPSNLGSNSPVSPMAVQYNASVAANEAKDLFRDIILHHQIQISITTVKLLVAHAAILKDTEETTKLIAFLKAYQAASPSEVTDSTEPTSVLGPGLSINIAAFNSFIDIFSHHGDTNGATLFFTELKPAGSMFNNSLLFGFLAPNLHTYISLMNGFAKTNQLDNALAILEHVRAQAQSQNGEVTISDEIFESIIQTLVENGHMNSAIVVLQKLQNPSYDHAASLAAQEAVARGESAPQLSTNMYGLQKPSAKCFLPILLEIPRFKLQPSTSSSPSSTSSYAALPASATSFDTLPIDEQMQFLFEIYKAFRGYGYDFADVNSDSSNADSQLVKFIHRVALMGTGMEIQSNSAVSTNSANTSSGAKRSSTTGFTERNFALVQHPLPSGASPPSAQSRSYALEFSLQILQERLMPFLPNATSAPSLNSTKPTVEFLNSMLYLYGVVVNRIDLLTNFIKLFEDLSLHPNIHTMNCLMESYGTAKMHENVSFMYLQVKQSYAAAATNPGAPIVAPNIQTINIVLNYAIGNSAAIVSSNAPRNTHGSLGVSTTHNTNVGSFAPLNDMLADIKSFKLSPNSQTWALVLRKLLEISGNAEEADVTAYNNAVASAEVAFARPLQEPGVVFAQFTKLIECEQASSSAATPSAASTSSLLATLTPQTATTSSLTEEIVSQYLLVAAKLGDTPSVMSLLSAMRDSVVASFSSNAAAVSSDLSKVARALPAYFCREYFASRENLRAQLTLRIAQLDWKGCIAMLKIWQEGSVHALGSDAAQTGAAADSVLDTDHFAALFRHVHNEAELQSLVRYAVEQLVWSDADSQAYKSGKQSATLTLPVRASIVSHMFRALLVHNHFSAAFSLLDWVATLARDGGIREAASLFPDQALPQLMQSLRTAHAQQLGERAIGEASPSNTLSVNPLDSPICAAIFSKIAANGIWHGLVPLDQAVRELNQLLLDAIQSNRPVEQVAAIWSQALSLQESTAWFTEDGKPATTPSLVKNKELLQMTTQFMLYLCPKPEGAYSPRKASLGSSTSTPAPTVDVFSPAQIDLRMRYMHQIVNSFTTFFEPLFKRKGDEPPRHIYPLLDSKVMTAALTYAMQCGSSNTVYTLYRYATGRSNPNVAYFSADGEPLKHQPRTVALPEEVYEKLFQFCMGTAVLAQANRLNTPLFTHAANDTPRTAAAGAGSSSTALTAAPNPILAMEAYLHFTRNENRKPSPSAFRNLILLQGCFRESTASTNASVNVASTSISSPTNAVAHVATASEFFSINPLVNLINIWKQLVQTRPWYDALSLLPSVLAVLPSCQSHAFASSGSNSAAGGKNTQLHDLERKEVLLKQLETWALGFQQSKLPLITNVDEGSVPGRAKFQRRPPDSSVQHREEKKLTDIRRIMPSALQSARAELATLRAPLLAELEKQAQGPELHISATSTSAAKSANGLLQLPPLSSQRLSRTNRLYTSLLKRISTSNLLTDKTVDGLIVELAKSPRDFVDVTLHKLIDGEFVKWDREQQRSTPQGEASAETPASADANSTVVVRRNSAEVFSRFFASMLYFMYCKGLNGLMSSFLLAIGSHPHGLAACFTPSVIVSMYGTQGDVVSPAPTASEDASLEVMRSIISTRTLEQSRWTKLDTKAHLYLKTPAKNFLNNHISQMDAAELLFSNHPVWWLNQSLYWHYQSHSLNSDSFQPDYLFSVKASTSDIEKNGGVVAPMSSQTLVQSPYYISPRVLYDWCMQQTGPIEVKQILFRSYLNSFQFLVQRVIGAQSGGQYMSRIQALGSTTPASNNAASSASRDSPQSAALHAFTFQLFKQYYMAARTAAQPLTVREKRPLSVVESLLSSAIRTQTLIADPVLLKELSINRTKIGTRELNEDVYRLFHSFSEAHPQALSEAVYNIVLASFVQFRGTGLSPFAFSCLKAITPHMSQVLGYNLEPVAVVYIAEACLEQAMWEMHAGGSDVSAGGAFARARVYLSFAQGLVEQQRSARKNTPFVFGASSQLAIPVIKPQFPQPAGGPIVKPTSAPSISTPNKPAFMQNRPATAPLTAADTL